MTRLKAQWEFNADFDRYAIEIAMPDGKILAPDSDRVRFAIRVGAHPRDKMDAFVAALVNAINERDQP